MTEEETQRLNDIKQKIKDGSHCVDYIDRDTIYIDQETVEFLLNLVEKHARALYFAAGYISTTPRFENEHPNDVLDFLMDRGEKTGSDV